MKSKDKHQKSNEARLESLRQRNEQASKSKLLIQNALKNLDTPTKQHIKFDSSDEDDQVSKHDEPRSNGKVSHDVLGLGSDMDEEEEFVLKPQFEGKFGKKLLELQARVGMDERFKIDERFAESSSEGENDDGGNLNQQIAYQDSTDEMRRNLSILREVVGPTTVKSSKRKASHFLDPTVKRYDPTKQGHTDMEIQVKEEASKSKKKKKKKTEVIVPEVEKDRFYEISNNDLKSAFGKASDNDQNVNSGNEAENKSFSLLNMFGRAPDEVEMMETDEIEDYKVTELGKKLGPKKFQQKLFAHDSTDSSSSDTEDENMMKNSMSTEAQVVNEEMPKMERYFLFSENDSIFTDAPKIFCSNKSSDQIRQEWLAVKDSLKADYKKKHRDAVRLQKKEMRQNRHSES
ncbi:nucleolar protein 8-like [Clavelina lepadiformis]|uniref:nucleolar protein 8-like n=1 Tax=Clavelina lepadiformis TaxID=159417 RepID=UPI0040429B5F